MMRSPRHVANDVALLLASVTAWASLGSSPAVAQTDERNAGAVYERACVACHGADGRGAPISVVGFDLPLPDFTDCSFASREPDSDWLAIVHDGGPARAFDAMMPAFGEALTPDELEESLARVRAFCRDASWPRGELNLPRPLVTEKAYPEDEAVLTTTFNAEGATAVTNALLYEHRFGARNQFEILLPFASQESGTGRVTSGFGDVAVAVKRAVAHSARRGSIFSVSAEVVLPTGNERDGFGKGTAVVEPFVTYGQLLPLNAFVQLQGGVELPFDTEKAEREAFWRAVIGKSITQGAFGRTWSPMLEVLASRALESGEKSQWDLLPQVQVTLSTRQHIMANVGVRVPVTETSQRDTQILVYLLWDWFDGGFFEGW